MQTVLIVEDEWAIAEWLQVLLDEQGFEVLVAGNGKAAMDMLATRTPDLVLTDFMMPIMDGATFLRALKRNGFADVPVILMSSLPEMTVRERCDGYRAFLRKPFREAELLALVRRELNSGGRSDDG